MAPTTAVPPLAIRAQLRWDVVRPIVEALAPQSTIEVGVGAGAMGARIARMTRGTYEAFEIDQEACLEAKARIEPVGVVHAAMLADVDPAPADLVCAFEVLEHIEKDQEALAEWAGYVKPGGHLVLSVPANPARFGPMDVHAGHFRRYTPEGLKSLAEAVGLTEVTTTLYGAPLGYALEFVRNRIDAKKLESVEDTDPLVLTAASGRTFQFSEKSWKSTAATVATFPFTRLQRVWPAGVGLVMQGRRPAS